MTHALLRRRLLERAGLWPPPCRYDLAELWESEWCEEFVERCRNRLVMGKFRGYPHLAEPDAPNARQYLDRAAQEIAAYRTDGNLEHLVDAANMMHAEYARGRHPRRHWGPADDGPHLEHIRGVA